MDWGLGMYEHIAAQLLPAARVVVDRAAPAEGDRMLAIYDAANEDPDGFRITSRYVVATARRR
jgi:hypothetical protein